MTIIHNVFLSNGNYFWSVIGFKVVEPSQAFEKTDSGDVLVNILRQPVSEKENPDSFREKVSIKSELLLKAFLFADSCEIAFLIRLFHQNCQIIKRTIHLNIDVGVVLVVKNFLDFSEISCKGILG